LDGRNGALLPKDLDPTMPKGRRISLDLRLAIVNMWLEGIGTKYISRYLGISRRSVQRIVANARAGYLDTHRLKAPQPPRKLHEDALRVSAFPL
jgi:transposase